MRRETCSREIRVFHLDGYLSCMCPTTDMQITFLELLLTDALCIFLFLTVVSVASFLFALLPPILQALLSLLHQPFLESFQFFLWRENSIS